MAQEVVDHSQVSKKTPRYIWLYLLLAAIPIILLALYYIFNSRPDIMDWINMNIAAPYRDIMAKVTSFGPFQYFSLAEILAILLVLWTFIYIVKTVFIVITRPQRLANLGHRVYVLAMVALYLFTLYSWTWGIGYYSTDFSQKSGLNPDGISVEQLKNTAVLFAEQANALSVEVRRDENGHFLSDTDYYFALSKGVYTTIANEFPELGGTAYPPKAMLLSKLMSATGFTGVYIALTGETNINVDAPACLIPATIAHEMAHQRGINAEEEANFAAIAACITSNIPSYEYSGYLSGLIYLTNALNQADPAAYSQIMSTLNTTVIQDWSDNYDYWYSYQSPTADAVSAMYDGYLKYNGEALGVSSYGACVDLLASWMEKTQS